MGLLNMLQAAVEYGAATGQAVGVGPNATGVARLGAWASEHQIALAVAAAGLLLFWMIRSSVKR